MVISVAKSRKSKIWSKKELTWSEFVESLKKPIVTDETQEEYFNMPKAQQDEIKDVGGFVGGELKDGRRKSDHVINRCILTLDADYANKDFNDYINMFFNFTYCIYSTHKHTKDNPRFRLIIPLSRTCDAEEYEAVARMVAKDIDINLFDDTTYQPHRLMYYPSVSKDGDYVFECQEKEVLNVDEVLSRYKNWKNREEWAVSKRTTRTINNGLKKQQDPTTKNGIIGAFCKVYDIYGVIEKYLSDIYVPCEGSNRYTYSKGSTYGGMLVYDNGLFSYSNHSTDPTNGRLCNAFDLLRIHKFGHLDADLDSRTNIRYLQSFKAIVEFLKSDENIKKLMLKEKIMEARRDFKGLSLLNTTINLKRANLYIKYALSNKSIKKLKSILNITKLKHRKNKKKHFLNMLEKTRAYLKFITKKCGLQEFRKKYAQLLNKHTRTKKYAEHPKNLDWINELIYNKKGIIIQSIYNVELVLKNDRNLKNKVALDTFNDKICVLGSLPWNSSNEKRQWRDVDDAGLRAYLEKIYGLNHRNNIYDAWELIVYDNSFNSVANYLKSLKHDGIKRLDTLFIDYLGVEDNLYSREVTRKSLVGAVARVFEPGVKLDTSIVLVGSQGVGKSQIINRLGKEWYSDNITTVKGKEACEQIQGFWIIEIAELAAMKRVEIEAIKQFMSKQEDTYRCAYARNVKSHKRQCIFICTTNTHDCLKDYTGNRRFLPLDVDGDKATKDIWKDLNNYEVDQIWAEAVKFYKAGEKLILSSKANELAKQEQESHTKHNPLEGIINEYLDMPVPDDWYDKDLYDRINYIRNAKKTGKPRDKISAIEVWCELLEGDKKDLTIQKSREITNLILKNGEWIRTTTIRTGYLYGRQRGFKRKVKSTV